MIYIDGFPYIVDKASYSDKPETFATSARGLTGQVLIVESNIYQQSFNATLNVNQKEYEQLKTAFAKCHAGVFLNFVDERGVWYDTATGTDKADHKFSTGVWFASLSEATPTDGLFNPIGYPMAVPTKRFTTQVVLLVNAKALA
jgi:hypothetical protein